MPPKLVEYCEDIDLEGRDLQAFAHTAFAAAMGYGLTHILVDYPRAEGAQTLAEQRAASAGPGLVVAIAQSTYTTDASGEIQALRQLLEAVELGGVLVQAAALHANRPFPSTSPSAAPTS